MWVWNRQGRSREYKEERPWRIQQSVAGRTEIRFHVSQIGNVINAHLCVLSQLLFRKARISPHGYLNESPAEEGGHQTEPSTQVIPL